MNTVNIDPRFYLLKERIKDIKFIIPVISSKGGVGKSFISTLLSIAINEKKLGKVGLLDLDFWGASDHVILKNFYDLELLNGKEFPEEDRGIVPVDVKGIKFMSIVFYTGNKPIPMRGQEFTDAFIEITGVTRWGSLDYLIIDMPPGLNDPILDIFKYIEKGNFLVVTTPSVLSINVVRNTIDLVKSQNHKIIGVVENMSIGNSNGVVEMVNSAGIKLLGSVPFYNNLDEGLSVKSGEIRKIILQDVSKIADKVDRELRY